MTTTVGQLADELGVPAPDLLARCKAIGVVAWSEHTPLDDDEEAKVRAAVAPSAASEPTATTNVFDVAPGSAEAAAPPPPPPSAFGSGIPPPPPPMAGGYTGPPKTEGLAIASLILGLVGWIPCGIGSIVAVVLGFRAKRVIDQSNGVLQGRGMAVAGIALGFVGIAFAVLGIVAIALSDDVDDNGDSTEESDDGVIDIDSREALRLEIGDCYDQPGIGEDEEGVERTSCSEPHDAEVFDLLEHPADDDADYPGDSTIITYAQEQCLVGFEDYVGSDFTESALDISYFFPQEVLWNVADERTIVCGVYNLDQSPLTGSVEGSGR